jgi:protein gp37
MQMTRPAYEVLIDDSASLTKVSWLLTAGVGEAAASARKLDAETLKEIAALCHMNVAEVLPPPQLLTRAS